MKALIFSLIILITQLPNYLFSQDYQNFKKQNPNLTWQEIKLDPLKFEDETIESAIIQYIQTDSSKDTTYFLRIHSHDNDRQFAIDNSNMISPKEVIDIIANIDTIKKNIKHKEITAYPVIYQNPSGLKCEFYQNKKIALILNKNNYNYFLVIKPDQLERFLDMLKTFQKTVM